MQSDWRKWLDKTAAALMEGKVRLSDIETLVTGFTLMAVALKSLEEFSEAPDDAEHWCPICLWHDPMADGCAIDCDLDIALSFLRSVGNE